MNGVEMALFAIVGVLMGFAYFSGLWYTIRRMGSTANPTRTLVVSFLVRAALLAAAFVWLARFGLWALGMAMFGFLASRLLATAFLKPRGEETR